MGVLTAGLVSAVTRSWLACSRRGVEATPRPCTASPTGPPRGAPGHEQVRRQGHELETAPPRLPYLAQGQRSRRRHAPTSRRHRDCRRRSVARARRRRAVVGGPAGQHLHRHAARFGHPRHGAHARREPRQRLGARAQRDEPVVGRRQRRRQDDALQRRRPAPVDRRASVPGCRRWPDGSGLHRHHRAVPGRDDGDADDARHVELRLRERGRDDPRVARRLDGRTRDGFGRDRRRLQGTRDLERNCGTAALRDRLRERPRRRLQRRVAERHRARPVRRPAAAR